MIKQIDFFITSQVFKVYEEDENSKTFLVPSYIVQRCIDYANHLHVVNSKGEQISLSPYDLVQDEIEVDKTYKKKYKFDKIKYGLVSHQETLDDEKLRLLELFGWSWYNVLRYYITTDTFLDNLSDANYERQSKSVLPSKDDVFRAFKVTNYDNIRVVILGQDPYPKRGQANGIGFAVENNIKKPFALQQIENQLKLEMDYPSDFVLQNDLIDWCKQGVLLLNRSLTVVEGKPGSHERYWTEFTRVVIEALSDKEKPILFCLLGSQAQRFKKYINKNKHSIIEREHPTKSFYENREWYSDGMFKTITEFLINNYGTGIKWIK